MFIKLAFARKYSAILKALMYYLGLTYLAIA